MTAMESKRPPQSTLILTSGPVLSLEETDAALALCAQQDDGFWSQTNGSFDSVLGRGTEAGTLCLREGAHVMTSALHSKDTRRIESTHYDAVVVVMESPGNHNHVILTKEETRRLLSGAATMIRPGGYLYVLAPGNVPRAHMQLELTMLGFSGICILESVDVNGTPSLVAKGAKYEKKEAQAISRVSNGAAQTWKLAIDDDDDELIDEDEILGEEDVVIEAAPVESSCGATAKKACANCTCGRAEGKVTKLTKAMIANPQSGCGSCSLGDAFRCAGCPYRGLPAFEMGKKIELPSDFLVDDLE